MYLKVCIAVAAGVAAGVVAGVAAAKVESVVVVKQRVSARSVHLEAQCLSSSKCLLYLLAVTTSLSVGWTRQDFLQKQDLYPMCSKSCSTS